MRTTVTRLPPVIGLALLAGCAATQQLRIETDPVGAEVYLQRRGDIEVSARVPGGAGRVDASTFEDAFEYLGTTPLEYEFRLREDQAAIDTPDVGGRVVKHYTEGTLRIELEGYRTVERRIRFTGEDLVLVIPLRPGELPVLPVERLRLSR